MAKRPSSERPGAIEAIKRAESLVMLWLDVFDNLVDRETKTSCLLDKRYVVQKKLESSFLYNGRDDAKSSPC